MTMVSARTPYPEDEVWKLTGSYIEVFMPDEKKTPGTDHERAVAAVRARIKQIEEKAKAAESPTTLGRPEEKAPSSPSDL